MKGLIILPVLLLAACTTTTTQTGHHHLAATKRTTTVSPSSRRPGYILLSTPGVYPEVWLPNPDSPGQEEFSAYQENLGFGLVAQGNRDFANGTPLYDSNGYQVGRRVHNSTTGDTNNLGTTGRMLPPWQQW